MAKRKTAKKSHTARNVGIGIAATAAAAAAAGAYFLYGSKNAVKNRKKVKSWSLKAKAEVLEGIEKMKDMSEADYQKLIEKAVGKYKKFANSAEVKEFEKELKGHWKEFTKGAQKAGKKVAKKKVSKRKKTTRKKK